MNASEENRIEDELSRDSAFELLDQLLARIIWISINSIKWLFYFAGLHALYQLISR